MARTPKPMTIPANVLIDELYEPADRRDQCRYWQAIVAHAGEHGLLLDAAHVKRLGDLLAAAYVEFDINAPEPQ